MHNTRVFVQCLERESDACNHEIGPRHLAICARSCGNRDPRVVRRVKHHKACWTGINCECRAGKGAGAPNAPECIQIQSTWVWNMHFIRCRENVCSNLMMPSTHLIIFVLTAAAPPQPANAYNKTALVWALQTGFMRHFLCTSHKISQSNRNEETHWQMVCVRERACFSFGKLSDEKQEWALVLFAF